jgi:putative oxidoreductase
MNLGLLILRMVIGLTVLGHGSQKLFGSFGGPGLAATGETFHALGYRPGKVFAAIGGLAECLGGLLLALGLLTPLAAAAIMGTMFNALLSVHGRNGFWAYNEGYEYLLVLIAAAGALAFTGAGLYSLDHLFGWRLGGDGWGVFGVALGAVTALATEFHRRHSLVQPEPAGRHLARGE